ncbi:hypothetical protein AX767_05370 [Variovorax sp. PAMC 28711]|nr:hypothetical protein AX767_05370 [Variovorax sp. PAMC 28711]
MSERVASAPLDARRRIEIKFTMNRMDCVVQPRLDVMPESIPPVLFDAVEEIRDLARRLEAWLSGQQMPIYRVAIGGGALFPVADRDAGYRKLAELLSFVNLDSSRHKDFQLRVNTPLASALIPDLQINALATWASIFVNASMFDGTAPTTGIALNTIQNSYVQSILDVNTDADRNQPIPREKIVGVISELASVCDNILNKGMQ